MYLVEKIENEIKIYTLEPDEEKVLDFKEKYLCGPLEKTIPEYKAKTNLREDILKYNECKNLWDNPIPQEMDSKDLIFHQGLFGRKYHVLEEDHYARHFFYRSYMESVESNAQILDVFFTSNVDTKFTFNKHFLLLKDRYEESRHSYNVRNLEGIIEIPYPIYLYELIMQGHFSHIKNNIHLKELMNLFNIEPFHQQEIISLNDLESLEKLGLMENGYEKVLDQASECEKVLKYIKNT